jgi:MFS family permease
VNTIEVGERASSNESLIDSDGRLSCGWRSTLGSAIALSVGPCSTSIVCFGVYVPYLHRAFGWSIGMISFAATLLTISIALVAPIQGFLADRFGSRRLILISIPLYGIGYAAMSQLSGDIRIFYVMWLLLPVLGFGIWLPGFSKVVAGWFDRHLGLAVGISYVGVGVGSTLMPAVIGLVAEAYGWRTAYATVGAISILVAWPCAYFLIFEPRDLHRTTTEPGDRALQPRIERLGFTVRRALADMTYWKILISSLLLGAASMTMLVNQVAIVLDNGMSVHSAVALQTVAGAATLIARVFVGWLLDRVSVNRVMPAFALAAAVAMVLYANGAVGPAATLCALLTGLIVGAEFDVLLYALRRYFGTESLATLYGISYFACMGGGAIGNALFGYARSHFGTFHTGLYSLASAAILMGVLMSTLGRYRFIEHSTQPVEAPGLYE